LSVNLVLKDEIIKKILIKKTCKRKKTTKKMMIKFERKHLRRMKFEKKLK